MSRSSLVLPLALLVAGGCTLLGGPEFYVEPNYYAVTAVGTGGADGSGGSGGSGRKPSGATTASAGGDLACDKSLCSPAKNPSCGEITCVAPEECGLVLKPEGTPCANEPGKPYCAKDGGCVECLPQSEKEHCGASSRPFCIDGACAECRTNDDCSTPGAIVCDPKSRSCVACVEGDDAPCQALNPSYVCVGTACKVPTCKNGALDVESESDVDCGGTCSPCATGKLCKAGADCATNVCKIEGSEQRCACDATSQCPATDYCSNARCVTKKEGGTGCSGDDQCKSNKCSTGFTCWFSPCCQ
jgi:hypothetical protein